MTVILTARDECAHPEITIKISREADYVLSCSKIKLPWRGAEEFLADDRIRGDMAEYVWHLWEENNATTSGMFLPMKELGIYILISGKYDRDTNEHVVVVEHIRPYACKDAAQMALRRRA